MAKTETEPKPISISFPKGTFGINLGAQFEQSLQALRGLLLQTIEEGPMRAGAHAATSSARASVSPCAEASQSKPGMSELFDQALSALLRCNNNSWRIQKLAEINDKCQELFQVEARGLFVEKALINILAQLWGDFPQRFIEGIASQTSLDKFDGAGNTLLSPAAEGGDLDMARLLIAAGADVNMADNDGNTPMQLAAGRGHSDIVQALIEAEADVNAADVWDGKTALHAAAWGGHPLVVQALLGAGANVNAADSEGITALQAAAWGGHPLVVQALLGAGADRNAAGGRYKETALHFAARGGHPVVVQALIGAKANVNEADSEGTTPLQRAASEGHLAFAQALIEAKADVNAANKGGCTPLHVAARQGRPDIVKALLGAGADRNAVSKWDTTPLHMADSQGHSEIAALLRAQAKGELAAAADAVEELAAVEALGSGFSEAAP